MLDSEIVLIAKSKWINHDSKLCCQEKQPNSHEFIHINSLHAGLVVVCMNSVDYMPTVSYRRLFLAFQFSPFACSLYSCILCISCICFALTLPVSGLSFMSIKLCSVLFCSADLFQNKLFRKILSGTLSECQNVRPDLDPNCLGRLSSSLARVELNGPHLEKSRF